MYTVQVQRRYDLIHCFGIGPEKSGTIYRFNLLLVGRCDAVAPPGE